MEAHNANTFDSRELASCKVRFAYVPYGKYQVCKMYLKQEDTYVWKYHAPECDGERETRADEHVTQRK